MIKQFSLEGFVVFRASDDNEKIEYGIKEYAVFDIWERDNDDDRFSPIVYTSKTLKQAKNWIHKQIEEKVVSL